MRIQAIHYNPIRIIVISVFACVILFMGSMLANSSYAQSNDNIIEINTVDDLYNVRNDMTAHYKLMNDLDLTEYISEEGIYCYKNNGWEPLGNTSTGEDKYGSNGWEAFTGVFDGNNHSIKGLKINVNFYDYGKMYGDKSFYTGLFISNEGIIENLHIVDCDLYARAGRQTNVYSGAITALNDGTIRNCSVTGSVVGENNREYGMSTYDGNARYSGICCTASSGKVGSIEKCYTNMTSGGICLTSQNLVDCYSNRGLGGDSRLNCYVLVSYDGAVLEYIDSAGKVAKLNSAQAINKSFYKTLDFENVWTIETATDYKYPQLKSNMQDDYKHVDILEWKTQPSKVDYYTDEEPDPTGGVFTAYYIDDTHEDIEVTEEMLSGYDMNNTGVQPVTVTFREGTLSYDIITSTRPEVKSLTLESMPDKTEFVRNTSFDFTGATARVEYVNGTSDIIPIKADDTTGGDITKSGTYTITYEKFGKSISFDVKVVPVKETGINLLSLPDKTRYIEGQSLDTTGLVVELEYNNGKKEIVTGYEIDSYENTVGTREITVRYGDLAASFQVEFIEKTLSSIIVSTQPTKAKYIVGETFDATGMVVKAVYDNGFSEAVEDYTISPLTSNTGWQNLEISYKGKNTTVKVYVEDKELVSIAVSELPQKTDYIEGEAFDPTGLVVTANYNNVLTEEVSDYTISGVNMDKIGENNVTVLYEGKTASFKINIVAKKLKRIEVTPPEKTEYIAGEEFDAKSMIVKAFYDNGTSETITDYNINGFGESEETNIVTVEYQGKTSAFAVTIHTPNDEWEITTQPSCTAPGEKILRCKNCNVVLKTEEIESPGHQWGKWENVTSASCTDKGSKKRICSTCQAEEYADVDPKGHTPMDEYTVDQPASCLEEGIESIHCSVCGVPLEGTERFIEKLPHSYGEWSTTKDASCEENGQEQRQCSACNHIETREIAALGHAWNSPEYVWSANYATVTATRTCRNDATHIETETVNTTSSISKKATYTNKGETTYIAVFENVAFETQTKVEANIPMLAKKNNTLTVKPVQKTVKVKKLKKKALKVAPLKVTNAKGTVTYKISGGNTKSKKALKINAKTGKVTVKKKTKKGTYKVRVTVKAAGTTEYKPASKTVTITVKAK